IGVDMSRFPTIKHFTSWLGLCPGTKITGGKVMSGKTKRCVNRAAQALRLAAAALRSSKSALGAYFRRLCSRMDKPKAVTAAAHKLARLIYTMLTKGAEDRALLNERPGPHRWCGSSLQARRSRLSRRCACLWP